MLKQAMQQSEVEAKKKQDEIVKQEEEMIKKAIAESESAHNEFKQKIDQR
jgi:hypothetical protein